jgi:anti-sigma factor RsiW
MDSQSQAFASLLEAPVHDSGVPLRCPQPMPVQPLSPWTLSRVAGAVLALVPRPAALFPAMLTNRNRRA